MIKHRFKVAARRMLMQGGSVHVMTRHAAFYAPRGPRLIVTFDNMKSRNGPRPYLPWGHEFIAAHGWSHLGFGMARRNDWCRHPDIATFLISGMARRIFARHDEVVFCGSSMGGYGALAHAYLVPRARVVAFNPQTSLNARVAPFETRYRAAIGRGNWRDPLSDAAYTARVIPRIAVFADLYQRIEAAHVARHRLARPVQTGHARLVLNAVSGMRRSRPDWVFPRIAAQARAELRRQFRVLRPRYTFVSS